MDTTKTTNTNTNSPLTIQWFVEPCGKGKHKDIYSDQYATCLTCKSVRKIGWTSIASRWFRRSV